METLTELRERRTYERERNKKFSRGYKRGNDQMNKTYHYELQINYILAISKWLPKPFFAKKLLLRLEISESILANYLWYQNWQYQVYCINNIGNTWLILYSISSISRYIEYQVPFKIQYNICNIHWYWLVFKTLLLTHAVLGEVLEKWGAFLNIFNSPARVVEKLVLTKLIWFCHLNSWRIIISSHGCFGNMFTFFCHTHT